MSAFALAFCGLIVVWLLVLFWPYKKDANADEMGASVVLRLGFGLFASLIVVIAWLVLK